MRRSIQKYIEDPLAEELLIGKIKEGDSIIVKSVADKDELEFVTMKDKKPKEEKKNIEHKPETDSTESE